MMQPAVIERHQVGGDAIGEAALLAHLLGEPRGEAAAAEDVVHDIGGEEIGIVALDAVMAEQHHALRDVAIDDDGRAAGPPVRPRRCDRQARLSPAARRRSGRAAAQLRRRRCRRPRRSIRLSRAKTRWRCKRARSSTVIGLQARRRAAGRAAIGMVGRAPAPPGAAGDACRDRCASPASRSRSGRAPARPDRRRSAAAVSAEARGDRRPRRDSRVSVWNEPPK